MIAFSDIDLLVVLAQTDLISEALTVLNIQNHDVIVTSDVFGRTKNPKGFRNLGLSDPAKQRLITLIKSAQHITEAQDISVLATLSDHGIDPGEAMLFAATLNNNNAIIVTGDKRALNDLSQIPVLGMYFNHRVICLENLFLALFDFYGFNFIHQKVSSALESGDCENKTLKLCMKSHHTEPDAVACMNSGIRDLVNNDILMLFE